MATFLKRLSVSLDRRSTFREQEAGIPSTAPAGGIPNSGPFSNVPATSSNDASFSTDAGGETQNSPFVVGSAPAAAYMPSALSGIASRVGPLRIPAGMPSQKNGESPAQTPRSSLAQPQNSMSTPSAAVAEASGEIPASPRSPSTPGGRRRRSPKIDGLDYYEFCELLRSSSL